MARPYRNKTFRNLKSASTGIARSTGNLAAKGTTQAFKWAPPGNAEFIRRQSTVMEIMQGANFSLVTIEPLNVSYWPIMSIMNVAI